MGQGTRLLQLGAFCSVIACGEASYDLYEPQPEPLSVSATGGAVDPGDGDAALDPLICEAERDPTLTLVRLASTGSGLCVTQGPAILLMKDPGYAISLGPCAEDVAQLFTQVGLSDGAWELRHESSGYNLDIRYAATDDGTPAVLYEAHLLQNQRFYITPAPGNAFRLSPQNADQKCLEVRGSTLELWPCDATNVFQLFEQRPCSEASLSSNE